MGCVCRGFDIRSTKPILDEHEHVNHVGGKVLIASTLHGVWDFLGVVGLSAFKPFVCHIYLLSCAFKSLLGVRQLVHFGVAFVPDFSNHSFSVFLISITFIPPSNETPQTSVSHCFYYFSKYPL